MDNSKDIIFIKRIISIIDKWSFEMCAYCKNSSLVSIEGMVDYKCGNCKKKMNDGVYLGEIAKIVYEYRENQAKNEKNKIS